ncbi:C-signal-like [Carettochelys insculpta]|uniref:C-signal-like n=1 Tax=Carettochelys insculpta TaxID=44489 RepID=UPI003EC07909
MAGLNLRGVLVTGANQGIGLGLIKQLLRNWNPPEWVFATCRDPVGERMQELHNLAAKLPNLVIVVLKVTDPASIKEAAPRVEVHLKGSGLSVLINNVGILKLNMLELETPEDVALVYSTKVIGPLLMSQIRAFLPLLKQAAQGSPQRGLSCSKAAVANMSSMAGSIQNVCGWEMVQIISYRCSKVALNMLTKCQALRYSRDGILSVAVHPGWVQTDMGNFSSIQHPITVDESVRGMLQVLSTLSEKDNGDFVAWEGKVLIPDEMFPALLQEPQASLFQAPRCQPCLCPQ